MGSHGVVAMISTRPETRSALAIYKKSGIIITKVGVPCNLAKLLYTVVFHRQRLWNDKNHLQIVLESFVEEPL